MFLITISPFAFTSRNNCFFISTLVVPKDTDNNSSSFSASDFYKLANQLMTSWSTLEKHNTQWSK